MLIFLFYLNPALSYQVITSPWPPLVNCSIGSTDISEASGYYIDLISRINSSLSLDLTFLCTDYSTMMSSISNDSDSFAAGVTSITYNSLKSLKFSTPTYDSSLILITLKSDLSLFWIVFLPFDFTLWLFLICILIINSHFIWMAEQHDEGPIHVTYSVGIIESLQHSALSLFLISDIKLRTLSGRIIQLCYWFMGLLLLGVYLSNMSAILSIDWLSSDIDSYENIKNEKIGVFEEFQDELSLYCTKIVTYEWSFENSEKMVKDLESGYIKAAAMPYPFALYLSKSNCDYLIVGKKFIINYFAFAFPKDFNDTIYRSISRINLDFYLANYHRNLENKFLLVTDTGACNYSADIPLKLQNFGGVLIIIFSQIGFGYCLWPLIKLKLTRASTEQVNDLKKKRNEVDLNQAAEADLISKFSKILKTSEHKMKQKIRDYKEVLKVNSSLHYEFKEILSEFAGNLK